MPRIVFALLIAFSSVALAQSKLPENPGFEGSPAKPLPPHWTPLNIGTEAKFSTDSAEKHGGTQSVRIDAPEVTRSYVVSESMPVAAGEEIAGSAWVKVKDMTEGQGTCIMIAEFLNAAGNDMSVAKFDTADVAKASKAWQHIGGSVKVPDNAAFVRLRLGFSYAKGTCWWDDVTITPKTPLVMRLDLPEPRLSPAMETIPVLVINRTGAKQAVRVVVNLKTQSGEKRAVLSGEATQKIEVPIKLPPPGKVTAKAELFSAQGDTPMFSAESPGNIPAPIVLPPVSPTHWVIEDGPPKIEGRVDLAVSDARSKGATLEVEVKDARGQWLAKWSSAGKPIVDGYNDFVINAKSIPVGDYAIVARLIPRDGKPISADQPWHVIPRVKSKVTLTEAGYPQFESKTILPLGIFNGAKFKEQGEAGFTVTHAYNATRLEEGGRNPDQAAMNFLTGTEENGMKMLMLVPMKTVIRGDWDAVRRRIRMFCNHPALLAWDEEEGFGRGDFKPDTLKKLAQIVREEDPNHPFMVGDPRDVIGRVRGKPDFFPDTEMDMGMWWWYPLPLKAREANALEGEDAGTGDALELPTFLTQSTTKKPLWVGVQSYKKGDKSRYPTPEEYRCQAYYGLIGGAKGLMWYGGSVTGGIFLNPEEGHWDALKKIAKEIHDQEAIFLAPSLPTPTVTPANAPVAVMLKPSPSGPVLFAVNRSAKPVDVTITSPDLKVGSIKDHFEPFAVHIHK